MTLCVITVSYNQRFFSHYFPIPDSGLTDCYDGPDINILTAVRPSATDIRSSDISISEIAALPVSSR